MPAAPPGSRWIERTNAAFRFVEVKRRWHLRFTQPRALGRKAGDEFSPETRERVNYTVDHICEPISSTGPLAARWGKDTAYVQPAHIGNERDQHSVLRSVSRLLIFTRCITIRSHIAPRWHTREAADPAPFVTRQMRR